MDVLGDALNDCLFCLYALCHGLYPVLTSWYTINKSTIYVKALLYKKYPGLKL
jgi:hypothetical protein